MKRIYLLTCVLIYCCSFSNCDGTDQFACVELSDELISLDPDPVHATNSINAWLSVLPPDPTLNDPLGHEQNLNVFIQRFSQHCGLDVSIECYGCIETFPVQSHVLVRLDSAGTVISRTLDIRTPGDTMMTLLDIHQ